MNNTPFIPLGLLGKEKLNSDEKKVVDDFFSAYTQSPIEIKRQFDELASQISEEEKKMIKKLSDELDYFSRSRGENEVLVSGFVLIEMFGFTLKRLVEIKDFGNWNIKNLTLDSPWTDDVLFVKN